MNKIITIIGPSGVGKTSLVQVLNQTGKFETAFEQHDQRPFQASAKLDVRHTLANQLDYLILRAEQEKDLRSRTKIGLMDGGLDLDFHGFTRLFHYRNMLVQNEYDLCLRFYTLIREFLPLPELIIRLRIDRETVAERLSGRKRINIATAQDTALFESFLDEWLAHVPNSQVIDLDTSGEDKNYLRSVRIILGRIKDIF